MCDSDTDEFVNAIWKSSIKDQHGGEWRKHLPASDPDYASNGFDVEADRHRDDGRRAFANMFANGSENRLHNEWANYCRECGSLETFEPIDFKSGRLPNELEIPYCKKLNIKMPYEELDKKQKHPDCPLGTDYDAFVKRRTEEIRQEHKEWEFQNFQNRLNEIWPEHREAIYKLVTEKYAQN